MAEEPEEKKKTVIKELEDLPGVGEVSAEKLRKAGYDIEKIAASSPHELDEIADIGVETARRTISAARDSLEMGYESADKILERRKEIEAKYPPRAPVLTPVQHKSTILNTSPCPDLETREAVLGDQANLRDVDQGQSYQLLPGCALIRVNTTISRFSGSGYLFQEEVGTGAGKYWECGSITGNGPDECRSYLNARHGKVIRLIIQNGAGVFIN